MEKQNDTNQGKSPIRETGRKAKKETIKEKTSIKCNDENCPFHGSLKIRGRTITGQVMITKAQKTAKIELTRQVYLPKYERYEKKRNKIQVHSPPCIKIKQGDIVKIMECRPLSKTKNFVIIKNESIKS